MSATLALDLRAATAANLAGWHAVSLRALGIPERRSGDAWRALAPAPGLYFRWIGLRAPVDGRERAAQEQQAGHDHPPEADGWVSDPWAALDLTPFGLRRGDDQPWMVREPVSVAPPGERSGPAPQTPPELEIVRVGDADGLAAFEAVSAAGFEAGPVERFSWHAPGVLEDERFVAWIGLHAGLPVSVAMSYVDAGVVGVYGVATIPEARRRGYGAALTWQALSVEPRLPAVLQPSVMAEALYERQGFDRFASFATWFRPADGDRP